MPVAPAAEDAPAHDVMFQKLKPRTGTSADTVLPSSTADW